MNLMSNMKDIVHCVMQEWRNRGARLIIVMSIHYILHESMIPHVVIHYVLHETKFRNLLMWWTHCKFYLVGLSSVLFCDNTWGVWILSYLAHGVPKSICNCKDILCHLSLLYRGDLLGFFILIVLMVFPRVHVVLCVNDYVYEYFIDFKYSVIPHLKIKRSELNKIQQFFSLSPLLLLFNIIDNLGLVLKNVVI